GFAREFPLRRLDAGTGKPVARGPRGHAPPGCGVVSQTTGPVFDVGSVHLDQSRLRLSGAKKRHISSVALTRSDVGPAMRGFNSPRPPGQWWPRPAIVHASNHSP